MDIYLAANYKLHQEIVSAALLHPKLLVSFPRIPCISRNYTITSKRLLSCAKKTRAERARESFDRLALFSKNYALKWALTTVVGIEAAIPLGRGRHMDPASPSTIVFMRIVTLTWLNVKCCVISLNMSFCLSSTRERTHPGRYQWRVVLITKP